MELLDIATARLRIRNLQIIDLNDFYEYRSNPEVTKFQGFDTMDLTQAKEFIELNSSLNYGLVGEWVQYAIALIDTNQLIGDCAIKLDKHSPGMAEIGITISPTEQNKGFAKEAIFGILEFLFDIKKFHRIFAIVDAENISSIHLLRSLSFRQEGHFIENIFFKGQWGNEFQFAMLKSEWDSLNKVKSNTNV